MSEATGGMFSGHTSNGRVLVVDDEPDVRKVVKMTLTKAGYDVIEAEDGEKAIRQSRRAKTLYFWMSLSLIFECQKSMGSKPSIISNNNGLAFP